MEPGAQTSRLKQFLAAALKHQLSLESFNLNVPDLIFFHFLPVIWDLRT
jgi:hypothetical protein